MAPPNRDSSEDEGTSGGGGEIDLAVSQPIEPPPRGSFVLSWHFHVPIARVVRSMKGFYCVPKRLTNPENVRSRYDLVLKACCGAANGIVF